MNNKIEISRVVIERIVRDGSVSVALHDQLRQALDSHNKQPEDAVKVTVVGCSFNGTNEDGSEPMTFEGEGIKKLRHFKMVGWTCYGPANVPPAERGARSSDEPVVERQPVADENAWRLDPSKRCPNCDGHGTYLDGATCGTCKGSGRPPELAELQATIDNLTTELKVTKQALGSLKGERDDLLSENERLKGGQGEAVGWVQFGEVDDGEITDYDWEPNRKVLEALNIADNGNGTIHGLWLGPVTSQPAPVSVVLTDDEILEAMRPAMIDADGGYVFDTAKGDVIAAGRALLDKVKELNQ